MTELLGGLRSWESRICSLDYCNVWIHDAEYWQYSKTNDRHTDTLTGDGKQR